MTTKSTTTKSAAVKPVDAQAVQSYRLIGRGTTTAGKYKRHALVVHGTYAQAWEAMQKRYDEVTKGFKPETVFINVFEGKTGSGYRHDPEVQVQA